MEVSASRSKSVEASLVRASVPRRWTPTTADAARRRAPRRRLLGQRRRLAAAAGARRAAWGGLVPPRSLQQGKKVRGERARERRRRWVGRAVHDPQGIITARLGVGGCGGEGEGRGASRGSDRLLVWRGRVVLRPQGGGGTGERWTGANEPWVGGLGGQVAWRDAPPWAASLFSNLFPSPRPQPPRGGRRTGARPPRWSSARPADARGGGPRPPTTANPPPPKDSQRAARPYRRPA